ncbi:hypothetical protein IPV10_14970 [Microbacterium sp. SD291]|nr:hypothetical protein [Microbacterium sp. SD291]
MLNRIETAKAPAAHRRAPEQPIVDIDPDFHIPAGGERGNSYLRAIRILFPKAS